MHIPVQICPCLRFYCAVSKSRPGGLVVVQYYLLALEFSDLFRLAENACAHRYGKQKFDARGNRSHNLAIWSRMRYQCATTSKLTSSPLLAKCWKRHCACSCARVPNTHPTTYANMSNSSTKYLAAFGSEVITTSAPSRLSLHRNHAKSFRRSFRDADCSE